MRIGECVLATLASRRLVDCRCATFVLDDEDICKCRPTEVQEKQAVYRTWTHR